MDLLGPNSIEKVDPGSIFYVVHMTPATSSTALVQTLGCGLAGVNDEDDKKIQEFMAWHNKRVKRGCRDIPVKELRHIIPAFVLRCFVLKEGQQKKGLSLIHHFCIKEKNYHIKHATFFFEIIFFT